MGKDQNITLPLAHMNGTGLKSLREDYDLADDTLDNFIAAWERIEFNARDYYPLGPDAWTSALESRQAINRKLREVKAYIDAHREHLYSQEK
jgi:hypothetical protein